jgi:hypothetical protein
MITIVNNGNTIAEAMHQNGDLKDGLDLDQIAKMIEEQADDTQRAKRVTQDDCFWEDFSYTAHELGYKLKY